MSRAAAPRQLVELACRLGEHALPDAPPLTLPPAPGLAVAMDPGGDESFGTHRCRLIADASAAPETGSEAGIAVALAQLALDGVDAARPWARRDERYCRGNADRGRHDPRARPRRAGGRRPLGQRHHRRRPIDLARRDGRSRWWRR